jgi:hypothetical protein
MLVIEHHGGRLGRGCSISGVPLAKGKPLSGPKGMLT